MEITGYKKIIAEMEIRGIAPRIREELRKGNNWRRLHRLPMRKNTR